MTAPLLYFAVYNATNMVKPIAYKYYMEQYSKPIWIREEDYSAGDAFVVAVKYLWFNSPGNDYTVRVTS